MPVRPERLWDQYEGKAKAEILRGSGWWPLQESTCALEPPFDEYTPSDLTPWDCWVNDWEAPYETSWLRRAFSLDTAVQPANQPLVLPYVAPPHDSELVVLTVEQFPDDETTMPVAQRLLHSLLALQHPVAFELVGMGAEKQWDTDRVGALVGAGRRFDEAMRESFIGWSEPYTALQFVAHRDDAALLEQQLLLHYPNSAIVAGQTPPSSLSVPLDDGMRPSRGAMLALERSFAFPLRTFRDLAPDVLAVAIAAMETLGRGNWALLQVLFCPARHDWQEPITAALSHPYKPGEYFLDSDDMRQVKLKFQSPLFAVSVRLLASRPDVFQQLMAWARQFNNPPRQSLIINDAEWERGAPSEEDRLRLQYAAEARCSFRPGTLLNADELAGMVHLPGQAIVSERLRQAKTRTRPAKDAPAEPGSVVLGKNVHRGKTREARIPADVRPWHCYVVGATGTGKSTLLLNMALQDIVAGHGGVAVLDPHGDLVRDVLSHLPAERLDDVIYFNPGDREFPAALNILAAGGRDEREYLVSQTIAAFRRLFSEGWGPRLEHILLHTLATTVQLRGGTLYDARRLLVDGHFRFRVVSKLTDPDLVSFWNDEFPTLPKGSIDPVLNKLSPFLMRSVVRNIACQRECLIDFDALLRERKILLANLSFGLLKEDVGGTLGSFLLTKILSATFRRSVLPKHRRVPFYVYADEFQHFVEMSRDFDKVLSEARKFGLVLAGMANQYVRQLSPELRAAVLGNVGTVVTFRLGLEDANQMARDLQAFTAEEIMSLELGQAFARVGSSGHVFNLATYPPPAPPDADLTPQIVANSRTCYARPRAAVESQFRRPEAPASPTPEKRTKNPSATKTKPPTRPEATPEDLADFVS